MGWVRDPGVNKAPYPGSGSATLAGHRGAPELRIQTASSSLILPTLKINVLIRPHLPATMVLPEKEMSSPVYQAFQSSVFKNTARQNNT
jgi:hypothetical protein